MDWKKMNFIFVPKGTTQWMQSHAQVPTVIVLDNCLRVYFSSRNNLGKSQIGIVDLDLNDPSKIVKLYAHPALQFGKPGTFDDDGVMPSHIEKVNNQLWLFYTGWNQRNSVPYHNATGIAISEDNGLSFTRLSDGPILDRTVNEPYIAVTPCIMRENTQWKMWYASGVEWLLVNDKYEPIYVVKYAESNDGINWQRDRRRILPTNSLHEATVRPTVIKIDSKYHMWFCFRGSVNFRDGENAYRIGYASSQNGIDWIRDDSKSGIGLSADGWDSAMICYPNVSKVGEHYYMFYNGNGFGRSGFGYAILSKEKNDEKE